MTQTDAGMAQLLGRIEADVMGHAAAAAGTRDDIALDPGDQAMAGLSAAGAIEMHLGNISRELTAERRRKAAQLAKRLRGIAPVWLPPMPFNVTNGSVVLDPSRATTAQELGPTDGYIWFITRAVVAGLAGATAGQGASISGTQTNPGAGATITSINGATLSAFAPRGGLFNVTWWPSLQGTIAAADANNMRLTSPLGTTQQVGLFPGLVGNYGPFTHEFILGAGNGINVQAIAAASGASAVYGATINAVYAGGGDVVSLYKVNATLNNFLGNFSQAAPDKAFSSSSFFLLPDDYVLLTGSGLSATQILLNMQAVQVELGLVADYLM